MTRNPKSSAVLLLLAGCQLPPQIPSQEPRVPGTQTVSTPDSTFP
ncbi:MAG: hypothetical protein RM022_008150 [Nostoc sp. EfeVER01]|nr:MULTISPECIES: hypothetical protein [unclassified Nostoc]MDZ7949010.1 hypothetical protein [Nostoc sp. EfeVER01]MDZ7992521.1 hypothetical protein [Nostoc sp. EspVER01]